MKLFICNRCGAEAGDGARRFDADVDDYPGKPPVRVTISVRLLKLEDYDVNSNFHLCSECLKALVRLVVKEVEKL